MTVKVRDSGRIAALKEAARPVSVEHAIAVFKPLLRGLVGAAIVTGMLGAVKRGMIPESGKRRKRQ